MYEPTAAYMKPLKSGTAPMRSTPSASYIHDPASVLNTSITVPVTWNSTITQSSRPDSRRVASMTIWMITAATVRKSLRAKAASSGYHRRAATITTSSAAPKTHAHACFRTKTPISTRTALAPDAGDPASSRWATPSIRRSSGVGCRIPRRYPTHPVTPGPLSREKAGKALM